MEIVGLNIMLNGEKVKCSHCNRMHTRTFICENEQGTKYYYGSGCVQKQNIPISKILTTLVLVNVHISNLLGELNKKEAKQ